MPENYECVKCEDKNPNEEWIEEALKKRNAHLQKLQLETNIRKISVQARLITMKTLRKHFRDLGKGC